MERHVLLEMEREVKNGIDMDGWREGFGNKRDRENTLDIMDNGISVKGSMSKIIINHCYIAFSFIKKSLPKTNSWGTGNFRWPVFH